jgi:hypothetical protein
LRELLRSWRVHWKPSETPDWKGIPWLANLAETLILLDDPEATKACVSPASQMFIAVISGTRQLLRPARVGLDLLGEMRC